MDDLDTQMKKEIQRVKDEYNTLIKKETQEIREKYKQLKKKRSNSPTKKVRKSIPKSVKDKVWDTCIGKERGVGSCYCCCTDIDSKKFDCGHIVASANGGLDIVENLKPVCSTCNKSMGTQNLEEFKMEYFPPKEKPFKLLSKKCFCGNVKPYLEETCGRCGNFNQYFG